MPFERRAKPGGNVGSGVAAPDDQNRTSVETTTLGSQDLVGQTLGGTYRILELLDEGGMGKLYRAEHIRLKRPIAVKVLANHLAHNEGAIKRFNREAEIVSQLHHPHVIHILDFDQTEQGAPYIVMELLNGESLAHKLDRDRLLPIADVVQIVGQIAGALQTAHQMGIVHRDLKPDNVYLIAIEDEPIFVKLLDFGISKSTNNACKVTREFDVLGTPDYMAPEQAVSTAKADHRADQFALASMTYEMLTGRLPFVADNVGELLHKVVHENPVLPSYYAPLLPPGVDGVLLRAMAKRPDARYPHIQDYATALAQAAEVPLRLGFGSTNSTAPHSRPPVMASLPAQLRPGFANLTPSGELLAIAQRYEQSLPIPEIPHPFSPDDVTRAIPSAGRLPYFDANQNEVGSGQRMPHRPVLRSNVPNERESAPVLRASKPPEAASATMRSHPPASLIPPAARAHAPVAIHSMAPGVRRVISELEVAIAEVRRTLAFGEQQRAATQARRVVHMARDCDEKSARHCLSEATSLLEPLLLPQVGGLHRLVTLINARVSSQGDWTPAHFFLLSRIEQPTTIEDVLDVSPLTRPETLCFIADLSAQGIVRVE